MSACWRKRSCRNSRGRKSSIEYPEWRFNLRTSNTEPVVRLNVESRADTALMNEKTAELLNLLKEESL